MVTRPIGSSNRPLEDALAFLVRGLRLRQPAIVQAICECVRNVAAPSGNEDVLYLSALDATVETVVDYCLTSLCRREERSAPIPSEAILQARRAAQKGISANTVVQRYIVGHRLLGELVMDEVDRMGIADNRLVMRHIRIAQEEIFQRLTVAITAEYEAESKRLVRTADQRLAERVQALLDGQRLNEPALGYDLDAWHVAAITVGPKAKNAISLLQRAGGWQCLTVPSPPDGVWAWFGAKQPPQVADIRRALQAAPLAEVSIAIGEPARGLDGWRVTHRQAQQALRVAVYAKRGLACYGEVALEAALLADETLARALLDRYLEPLASWKDGPEILPRTLLAYFSTGHNVNATAAKLRIDRGTVRSRVRASEERLGCPLTACQAELEVALRIAGLRPAVEDEVGSRAASPRPSVHRARRRPSPRVATLAARPVSLT